MTAHNRWLPKTRFIPYLTTSAFFLVFLLLWLTWFWFTSHSLLSYECITTNLNDDWILTDWLGSAYYCDWLTTDSESCQSQSCVTTDGQSASLSWRQAPIWDLRPIFFLTAAGLLMWGALSDERTGLSFTVYNVQYIYILHVITWMYIHSRQNASVCPGSV
jgi:hypothetical protein